jgi:hypothetical protein
LVAAGSLPDVKGGNLPRGWNLDFTLTRINMRQIPLPILRIGMVVFVQ